MKILFFTYPSAFQNVGGGEIQILKTKEYLEKENVRVDLFDPWKTRVEDYDILHVFGSVKDCLGLMEVANKRNVRIVTSPVFWSDWRRAWHTDGGLAVKGDLLVRHFIKVVWPTFLSARRKIFCLSDFLFPNSEMEKKQISRLFAIPEPKMRVVYNGVDKGFLDADPALFNSRYAEKDFILSVGRIEPRKNQLNLIRAVKKIPGMKLFFIGSPVTGYEDYFRKCLEEGKGFAIFLPTLPHSDPLLKSAYAACQVFVLQGWFETPGLVALEAALSGARVVVTSGGSTQEYFNEYADSMDPSDPKNIHQKIVKNLNAKKNNSLRDHVLNNFTWDKIAAATKQHYEEILNKKSYD